MFIGIFIFSSFKYCFVKHFVHTFCISWSTHDFPEWAKRCVACFPVTELTCCSWVSFICWLNRNEQLKTVLFFTYYLVPPTFCRWDTVSDCLFTSALGMNYSRVHFQKETGEGQAGGRLPSSKNRLLLTLSATEWWSVAISAWLPQRWPLFLLSCNSSVGW